MTEPTVTPLTEAGRALLAEIEQAGAPSWITAMHDARERILAIEAEAALRAAPVPPRELREALVRIFSLDSNPGVVVSRATPEHLADEVLRELNAQGFEIVRRDATRTDSLDRETELIAQIEHHVGLATEYAEKADALEAAIEDVIRRANIAGNVSVAALRAALDKGPK